MNNSQRGNKKSQNRSQARNKNQNDVASWNRASGDPPGKRLCDEDIGVTEYISNHQGFTGVLKTRYSDFQVSEINNKGEVAELTCLTAPRRLAVDRHDTKMLQSKYNLEVLPKEKWDQLCELFQTYSYDWEDHTEEKEKVVKFDATDMSKEERAKIHESVREVFGNEIFCSTVKVDDKKFVSFSKFRKNSTKTKPMGWKWPAKYVYFVLHKENCHTMDAIKKIAQRLNVSTRPPMLGFASTKERRAQTFQWISLRMVDPRNIVKINLFRDIHVGSYSFSSVPLKLGMFYGNKYRIAVRNVTAPDEVVTAACEQLLALGFINYYGLQRFGTVGDAHLVGLKALQGNFKGAIDLLLGQRQCALQYALEVYWESGPKAAAAVLPRGHSTLETELVQALARDPQDIRGAFSQIPRNIRLQYLQAYQSLVWNRCVSQRVRRLGLKPAVGDLVPLADVNDDLEEELYEDECNNDTKMEDSPSGEEIDISGDKQDGGKVQDKAKHDVQPKIPVKILTQEDVDSAKYTFYDIVLPLPGKGVEYPPNMKDYYEELLTAEGLNLEMKHNCGPYSVSGSYRLVCARPTDVEWSFMRHNKPFEDLLKSDFNKINFRRQFKIEKGDKYKALLLTMSLRKSCFVNIALRELMKTETPLEEFRDSIKKLVRKSSLSDDN